MENIGAEQLRQMIDDDPSLQVIDVRTPAEIADGLIPGALPIPLDELRRRLVEIDLGRPTVVCCRSGTRSYLACRILEANGCRAINLSGGMLTWRFDAEQPARAARNA